MDLTFAIQIAALAHDKQKDKLGEEYILHPLAVMMKVKTPLARVVAVLHDVLEDADDKEKYIDLISKHFPVEVLMALDLLTHMRGDSYVAYIQHILDYPDTEVREVAIQVKLADLEHNMSRLHLIEDSETFIRLRTKYTKAVQQIKEYKGDLSYVVN